MKKRTKEILLVAFIGAALVAVFIIIGRTDRLALKGSRKNEK